MAHRVKQPIAVSHQQQPRAMVAPLQLVQLDHLFHAVGVAQTGVAIEEVPFQNHPFPLETGHQRIEVMGLAIAQASPVDQRHIFRGRVSRRYFQVGYPIWSMVAEIVCSTASRSASPS